jgi:hypothetical protein
MVRRARALGAATQERGAVLVLTALMLPVLIGMGGVVVDVGNWLAHKRHLQVQADAGALAGAGRFRVPCVGATIVGEAARYSSVGYAGSAGYNPGPGFNPQIGATPAARLHRLINSPTFYDQASPVDDSVATGDPCVAKMLDVKLTETDLPWFLRLAQVKHVNAQARVEIRKLTTGKGSLPIGIPEVGPRKAKALFVDEATGAVVASTDLARTGTVGGLAIWSNTTSPVPVTVDAARIGVRIVLSGSSSTQCGDPLVDCYGAGTSAAVAAGSPGLVQIRGWSATPAGTAAAPQPRSVGLLGGSCESGNFTATATADPCTVNVTAVVDFGATALAGTRVLALRTGANASSAVALTAPATSTGAWTGGAIAVTRGEGAVSIDLRAQTGCPTDRTKPCTGSGTASLSLGTVQRTFAGNESTAVSGPIKLVALFENGIEAADSFQRCATCSHDLVVKLGLKASLQNAQTVSDAVVSLKLAGGGSQNQALDCDPSVSNLRDEIAAGCGPTYDVNRGTACPAGSSGLWSTAQPWGCVAISTGASVGQVTQGVNQRVLGSTSASTCTAPNHWSSFPDLPVGDPRIVTVMLTPFGAFGGSGGTTVPVTGFATFYITGWDGGACQGNGDDPAGQGSIVGHYVKYIDTLNNGGGGDEFCDFDSLGSCVAVFTR